MEKQWANSDQMNAVKKAIIKSTEGNVTDFSKKAMILLLEKSNNMTQGVILCIQNDPKKVKFHEVRKGLHDIRSACLKTQLTEKMQKMGLRFYFCEGCYNDKNVKDVIGALDNLCIIFHHRANLYSNYKKEEKEAGEIKTIILSVTPGEIERVSLEV